MISHKDTKDHKEYKDMISHKDTKTAKNYFILCGLCVFVGNIGVML